MEEMPTEKLVNWVFQFPQTLILNHDSLNQSIKYTTTLSVEFIIFMYKWEVTTKIFNISLPPQQIKIGK